MIVNPKLRMDVRMAAKKVLETFVRKVEAVRLRFFEENAIPSLEGSGGFLKLLVKLAFKNLAEEEKKRFEEDFKDADENERPDPATCIKTLATVYTPPALQYKFDENGELLEIEETTVKITNPIIAAHLKDELSSPRTLAQRIDIFPILQSGISERRAYDAVTVRPAFVEAGAIPFVFGIIDDPDVETEARDAAIRFIREELDFDEPEKDGYLAKALLAHEDASSAPRILSLCVEIIQETKNLQEIWMCFAALSGIAKCAPSIEETWKVFSYNDNQVIKLAVAELKRAPGTGINMEDELTFGTDTWKYRESQPKDYACKMLASILTGVQTYGDEGEEKLGVVKSLYQELKVVDAVKPLRKVSETRDAAKEFLALMKGLSTRSSGSFDNETLEEACETVLAKDSDVEERAMALKDLTEMIASVEAQEAMLHKEPVIKKAVDVLLSKGNVEASEENYDLQDDDVRKCARNFLAAFPEPADADSTSPLLEVLASLFKKRFASMKPDDMVPKAKLLEPLRRCFEDYVSYSGVERALWMAGLRSFILKDILSHPGSDRDTCIEALRVIEKDVDTSLETQDAQIAWYEAGAAEVFTELIKHPHPQKMPKKKKAPRKNPTLERAPGFIGIEILCGAYAGENTERLLKASPELISLTVAEIDKALGPISLTDYNGHGSMDWEEMTREMNARDRPLKLLDELTSVPLTFKELKSKCLEAGVIELLERVKADGRDFGGYDDGKQQSMKELADQILERLALDELKQDEEPTEEGEEVTNEEPELESKDD